MDLFAQLFDEELILTNVECATKDEFFNEISTFLLEKGYVTEGFKEGLKQREQKYPTGLRTEPYHVAIPHTDPEHILKPFIVMVRPTKEIEFVEMGSDDRIVQAQLLFVLGLKKSASQAPLLQRLIDMFMKREVMEKLMFESEKVQLLTILETNVA